ncbi:hypothetical protein MPSEU_000603400 [Mayamaea pseudoterrestris]|nr:hypothetical protein MPSEU_000603400 [Mayamaea pseudoterrestris]
MLRQALDAANDVQSTESSLLEQDRDSGSYGATSVSNPDDDQTNENDSNIDEDNEDDENDSYEDDDYEEMKPPTLLQTMWYRIKSCFLVVANVENLWDDPPDPQNRRLSQLIVLFWFVVLACSYATERTTFKLLVDRAGCFRLFAVMMVCAVHALLLGMFMLISSCFKQGQESSKIKLGISVVDVGLMSLLDTVALILMFLSGFHVPPSLTVILVQFTLPLTAFLTQFVHPDGKWTCAPSSATTASDTVEQNERSPGHLTAVPNEALVASPSALFRGYGNYEADNDGQHLLAHGIEAEGEPMQHMGGLSRTHVWGAVIITSAVLLSLVPAVYSIIDPSVFLYADPIPLRTAINTMVYVSSCVPAAASQLYKEHAFLQYRQPVNMNYLNLLLSTFQFIFAAIVAPLVFGLQGLGSRGGTSLYPGSEFQQNMMDGLKCFFWTLSDKDQESKYAEGSYCDFCLGLTIIYALSIICLGVAVDKIVNAGATKVMYRGMSAGIVLAAVTMHAYDLHIIDFNYGPLVDGLNLISVILLILGSEIYHRVPLKESTFETEYPAVHFEYDDG